jgi:FkbM family methyltransferase
VTAVVDAKFSLYERLVLAGLRRLPADLRGKSRLARKLLGSKLDSRDVVVETSDGCRFLVPSLREPVAFHCLVDGAYEPETFAVMKRFLRAGGVFLDVGANVGVHAIPASKIVGEAGCAVAIEASPRINPYLARNIVLNACDNVRHVACAATSVGPGSVPFWIAPDDHFGMGAMAAQFHAKPVDVTADAIDNILASLGLESVDLIKVDIEGFESTAFEGARHLLNRCRPAIIFEFIDWAEARAGFSPGAAQGALSRFGYDLHAIEGNGKLTKLAAPLERGAASLLATAIP